MKIALLSFVFILALSVSAHARLGENADQLVARYGQPLKEEDSKAEGVKVASAEVNFQKGGFQINVTLVDGVSVAESFNKLNGDGLTIGEVRILLNANSQGYEWGAPVLVGGQKVWVRDDTATAALNAEGTVLVIKSKELVGAQDRARKYEESPTLNGF